MLDVWCMPTTAEILTLVDLTTLTDGLHPDSVCELDDRTPLPVATMRRLACDAHIIPVVLGGDGVVLDVGRSRRLATSPSPSPTAPSTPEHDPPPEHDPTPRRPDRRPRSLTMHAPSPAPRRHDRRRTPHTATPSGEPR
jgi:hypothetical protein